MTPKLSHMLSTSGLQPAPIAARSGPLELIRKDGGELQSVAGEGAGVELPLQTVRRTRIWEFDGNLHCSIVGTCLTTAELRHILEKLKVGNAGAASDHELHALGVMLAGERQDGAKFLQKALDRRHRAAIARYGRAKDAPAVLALWEESLKQGDIPGAYWAALTHPAATSDIVRRVFGDVHMLSHLVGAANRVDIRRLRQLEQDNAVLTAKIERQQRRLQEGFAARDQMIQRLNEMLARQAAAPSAASPSSDYCEDPDGTENLIRDLNKRLAREVGRRERAERQVSGLAATLAEQDRALQASRRECDLAGRELETIERHLLGLAQPETTTGGGALDLAGLALLYVGGRAHQIPQLKALIERMNGRMLHHDGGIEHSPALLHGLLSRADLVVFPVDCISHDAAASVKRVCRAMGKSYEPLRTASLACLVGALVRMRDAHAGTMACAG
jgi:hypothetical protein